MKKLYEQLLKVLEEDLLHSCERQDEFSVSDDMFHFYTGEKCYIKDFILTLTQVYTRLSKTSKSKEDK